MYDVPSYRIPEGCKMSDYAIKLCCDIRNDIDKEDAMDKLFRMTYPIMQNELILSPLGIEIEPGFRHRIPSFISIKLIWVWPYKTIFAASSTVSKWWPWQR